jgi:cyclase
MPMRLPSLCILLVLLCAAPAQAEEPRRIEIKSTRLTDNLYLLQGAGGNVAASVGTDGVLLVDAMVAAAADELRAAVKGLAANDRPVRFLIDTHYHDDHTGGNLLFAQGGAAIIAPETLRARSASGGTAGNGGSISLPMKPADPGSLATVTFDHSLTVHLNGEEIRAVHYANAHTDGDAIVFFRQAKAVHMGDIYVRYGFPFIDVSAGGSVQGMIAACEDVIRSVPAEARVIPGHGELADIAALREYLKMLQDTSAAVAAAIKAGKTLEQMKKERLLAPWSERYSPPKAFVDTDAFTESLFYSLRLRQAQHGHRPS